MKLNRSDKEAFVRAALDDVPSIDYDELAREKVAAWGLTTLPKEVQVIAKMHPQYMQTSYVYLPAHLNNVEVLCDPDYGCDGLRVHYPEFWAELTELSNLSKEQSDKRRSLQGSLRSAIEACSTLKQAKERLPEFEKYLPADRTTCGTANLPVANLIAELTEAGWPKDKPLKGEAK